MGEYLLESPITTIRMDGVDVVLGFHWIQSLETMNFNFEGIFIRFNSKGKENKLKRIQEKPSKLISSTVMKKTHKDGNRCVME